MNRQGHSDANRNGVIFHSETLCGRYWKPSRIHVQLPTSVFNSLLAIAKSRDKSIATMLKGVMRKFAMENAPDKHHGGDRSTTATAGEVRRITITVSDAHP